MYHNKKRENENYPLKLKVKRGEAVYPPRLTKGKDSELLYHSSGESGAEHWQSWMFSQEFQVMKGRTGDYWTIGPTAMEIKAIPDLWIMNTIANEKYSFLEIPDATKGYGFCSGRVDYERRESEWTTLELICFEDKSLHVVNGEVVMILKNSLYMYGGTEITLQKNKIQTQCEAAEVF
ncbi:DUF1080 domain-containing protein [Aestuariivivens sediminis]|uniref:DUF1080 domain-containing protein n=1 Tax=Aestuariivivens sediminis TaxID=2913557 RepID=UPI0021D44B94|nr:DUF1080 domain-containing protein [Aestuariivivens sediminis]